MNNLLWALEIGGKESVRIWTEGPLKLVERDSLAPEQPEEKRILYMARNSYESYQIVMYSNKKFKIEQLVFEGLPHELEFEYHYQETISYEKENFQDPLSNENSAEVEKEKNQSIWVTVHAKKNAKPDLYRGKVSVHTDCGIYETGLEIRVYKAVLPDTVNAAFETEYWMNSVNFWFRYPSPKQLDFFHYHYGCEKYSEKWWEINRAIARHMKENRINVLFVRTYDLLLDGGTTLDKNGNYHFCWELFDKWINFFDTHAQVKLFAGYHLVVQTEGKNIYLIDRIEEKEEVTIAPIGSQKAKNWLSQFLPALYEHLKQNGYKDRWLQHIEDEPGESESWLYARKWVRQCMPDVKCIDAIDKQEPMSPIQGNMEIWIPRVDIYENNREFYDYRLSQGDRRWVYNCCMPTQMNYTNKFLGWPLIHNRVLPWGCFVNHFSGFLHWGYNFWDPEDPWFGLNEKARIKGDGYICYPDPEHCSIKNSVRMIATRDGAQDFELLKLLADCDPKEAYKKAGKVIRRFNDFNWDEDNLEEIRKEILEELEEKWETCTL